MCIWELSVLSVHILKIKGQNVVPKAGKEQKEEPALGSSHHPGFHLYSGSWKFPLDVARQMVTLKKHIYPAFLEAILFNLFTIILEMENKGLEMV